MTTRAVIPQGISLATSPRRTSTGASVKKTKEQLKQQEVANIQRYKVTPEVFNSYVTRAERIAQLVAEIHLKAGQKGIGTNANLVIQDFQVNPDLSPIKDSNGAYVVSPQAVSIDTLTLARLRAYVKAKFTGLKLNYRYQNKRGIGSARNLIAIEPTVMASLQRNLQGLPGFPAGGNGQQQLQAFVPVTPGSGRGQVPGLAGSYYVTTSAIMNEIFNAFFVGAGAYNANDPAVITLNQNTAGLATLPGLAGAYQLLQQKQTSLDKAQKVRNLKFIDMATLTSAATIKGSADVALKALTFYRPTRTIKGAQVAYQPAELIADFARDGFQLPEETAAAIPGVYNDHTGDRGLIASTKPAYMRGIIAQRAVKINTKKANKIKSPVKERNPNTLVTHK